MSIKTEFFLKNKLVFDHVKMTSSSVGFDGGYTVLPPILSASNSQENLDIISNNVDKNSNSSDHSDSKEKTSSINSNKKQETDEGVSLPEAPFSSILQSRRQTIFDENR